jgi:hypothetical protein
MSRKEPLVEGTQRFHVGFTITAEEMRLWKPERIEQFFRGLAMAIEARCDNSQPSIPDAGPHADPVQDEEELCP